jgi:cytochrome c oxidase subunit III
MTVAILFFAAVAVIAGWWLAQQRLAAKPWLEEGAVGDPLGGRGAGVLPMPAARMGLVVFLAVVGSLFALLILAYSMRMAVGGDWRPLPAPKLLWLNTGALLLSSIALHRAQLAAGRGVIGDVRAGLLAGAGLTSAFLVGQLLAWWQLTAAGYFAASNPANAFFYLLTAVHGLHLLGGMVALGRTALRAWNAGLELEQVRLSVGLCATYWHFLLLVWMILFGLLLDG